MKEFVRCPAFAWRYKERGLSKTNQRGFMLGCSTNDGDALQMESVNEGLLELSDVMARLGREFKKAAETEDPVIEWYGATVELESVVERAADGGIRFWVVSGGVNVGDRNTIKVTVNVGPMGGEPMAGGM
jgi:hypothetical protein